MTITCSASGILTITAPTQNGPIIIHQSDAMPLNPKHPITKAELAWAHEKTGAAYGDLYDAVRAAMQSQRRTAA